MPEDSFLSSEANVITACTLYKTACSKSIDCIWANCYNLFNNLFNNQKRSCCLYANEKHVARICHTRRLLLFCLRVLPNQVRLGTSGVVRSVLSDGAGLCGLLLLSIGNGVVRSSRSEKCEGGRCAAWRKSTSASRRTTRLTACSLLIKIW